MPGRRWLVTLAFVLGSCGGSPSSATSGGGSGSGTGAGDEAASLPDRCEGPCAEGDACRNAVAWTCACTVHADVNCGGAPRELGPPQWAWSCTPLDPRADRGDGCPFALPPEDGACSFAHECSYPTGACGWDGVVVRCEGGRARREEFHLPPPP